MRKIIIACLFNMCFILHAQILFTDDFNSYTPGNVGTDTTWLNPGQGGYYTRFGSNEDFQIVTKEDASDKFFSITNGPGYISDSDNRYVRRPISATALPGNNIISCKLYFYTGSENGKGSTEVTLNTEQYSVIVGVTYSKISKQFTGFYPMKLPGQSFSTFAGVQLGQQTYEPNSWVPIRMTYDLSNGKTSWTLPSGTFNITPLPIGYTLVPGLSLKNLFFRGTNSNGNTSAYTWGVDDLIIESINPLMDTDNPNTVDKSIEIYPNPAINFINIKSFSKVKSVDVVDISGKIVTSKKVVNNQVDVRNLSVGTYIINVETENGIHSKKFVKK